MNALFAYPGIRDVLGLSPLHFGLFVAAVTIWSLVWKGVALWFSARNYQKRWFITLLVLNTVGILEIVYLLWFRRDKQEGVTKSLFNNPLSNEDEVAEKPST